MDLAHLPARLLASFTAAGVAALLAGCDVLGASVFPSYLPLVEDSIDVASYVPSPGAGTDTRLAVLNNGNSERLFLLVRRPDRPARLLILDTRLKIRADFSEDAVRTLAGGSGGFGGRFMVDANGDYVVGSFVFDQATLQPDAAASTALAVQPSDQGVANLPSANYLLSVDNSASPTVRLRVVQCNPSWAAVDSFIYNLASSGSNLGVAAAIRTYVAPLGYFVALSSDSAVVILFLDATGFEAGTLTQPLSPALSIPGVRGDSVQFTKDGVVARNDDGERQLWGYTGAEKDTYRLSGDNSGIQEAYAPEGNDYYLLDASVGTLYKLRTWW